MSAKAMSGPYAAMAYPFQNPATGCPVRIESTLARGNATRQLSQSIGCSQGIPKTESLVTRTACHRSTAPP